MSGLLEAISDTAGGIRLSLARHVQEAMDCVVVRMSDIEAQRRVATSAVGATVVVMTMGAATVGALTAYPHLAHESRLTVLETLDACTRSLAVHDVRGWLGRVPSSMLAPLADASGRCRAAVEKGWRAHSTGYVADPPADWWAMLVAAEDRRHGSWTSINCVDLPALGAAALAGLRGRRDRGGSTLAMQLARSLRGMAPDADERWRDRIRRKVIEVGDATVLCRALGGAHAPKLRQWVARHLPCIHGTASSRLGGSIYGLEDCGRILFGKNVAALDLAEQAIVVASFRRHVLLAPANDASGQRLARERWARIQGRALRALDLAFGRDAPAVAAARAKIGRMDLPTPMIAPALGALLPDEPAERVGIAANPERRVAFFVRGETTQALGEVLDLYSELPRNLIGIELTVDAADNAAFKRGVEETLDDIDRRQQVRLDLPPASRPTAYTADVTLSLADGAGHVVRHYSAGNDRIWSGANAKRDALGRYRPDREDRAIGSIAKMLAAPLIGARFHTTDAFCNHRLDGLRNPNGHRGFRSCTSSEAWVDAPPAFGKSLNLPIAWALRRVRQRHIEAIVADTGLRLPRDVAPRVAVAFGMVAGGTRAQHRLAAALNRGARLQPAWGVQPTLIRTLFFRDDHGGVRTVAFDDVRDRGRIDLSEWFRNPAVGPFVADVLAAPARRGGTLAGLDRIVGTTGGARLIAKSGTTTTSGDRIRDQIVAGSFVDHAGDQKTFHLLIGTPDPGKPLADRGGVSRRARLRLVEALLAER